jgi:hypothetical protein
MRARPRRANAGGRRARSCEPLSPPPRAGDVDALTRLLARDAVLWTDGGGKVAAALQPLYGAERIARFVLAIAGQGAGCGAQPARARERRSGHAHRHPPPALWAWWRSSPQTGWSSGFESSSTRTSFRRLARASTGGGRRGKHPHSSPVSPSGTCSTPRCAWDSRSASLRARSPYWRRSAAAAASRAAPGRQRAHRQQLLAHLRARPRRRLRAQHRGKPAGAREDRPQLAGRNRAHPPRRRPRRPARAGRLGARPHCATLS